MVQTCLRILVSFNIIILFYGRDFSGGRVDLGQEKKEKIQFDKFFDRG